MKNKCITASVIIIAIALLINMLGFHIYANGETYSVTNGCNYVFTTWYGGSSTQMSINTDSDVRTVWIQQQNSNTYAIYIVSNTPFNYEWTNNCATPSHNAPSVNYNNSTYYAYHQSRTVTDTHTNNTASEWNSALAPLYVVTDGTTINNQLAIRLTYGDLSIDPSPTVNYGELEISYQQNIITDGNGALNEDIIRWNAYRDTAGNDLQGKNIEIQAIAGYFQGSSYTDLKANNFTDWLNATHPAVTMYKGSIEKSYEVYEWGEVATNFRDINTLGMWFWNIFTSEDTWYQYGWRYQARILDEDLEPLTEWQMIYTGNSWTPSATETFTDDEPLTPDDVETINDINDENGTTNNWYINNTYITNNEYNQQYQQNIIENIYNILQGQPDDGINHKANDVQQTIDNAIDTEDNYMNDLETQLTDLELNDITTNNGLMKALRWVREVHHETIEETELGGIVLTIMLIGLITYLIGRRNG